MQPYAHAAWRPALTRMHANEAPWRPSGDATIAGLNRYPEPQPQALIDRMASLYGVSARQVLATRGADEAIDVLSRIYLRAGSDAILQCGPTFGMYQVAARIQGAEVIELPLDRDAGWCIDPERVLAAWRPHVKLVYLCSPNNPTANLLGAAALEHICTALDGKAIIVVDEAYIEWSRSVSLVALAGALSNTRDLAHPVESACACRCASRCIARSPRADSNCRRVIPPYALAQPTIEAALRALAPEELAASQSRLEALLKEKDHLRRGLERCALVAKVWPSDTNFLLVDCLDADRFMQQQHRRRLHRPGSARPSGAAACVARHRWAAARKTMPCCGCVELA